MRCNVPIHLVGVGTIGTQVAKWLAEDNIPTELHAWDGDTVEPHNVGPQTYRTPHVGSAKVLALQQQVHEWDADIHYVPHLSFVRQREPLAGIVFLGVDRMSRRWTVWESSIRHNRNVSLMIETRLEATNAYIFVIDPNDDAQIDCWERHWYPDEDATTAGMSCGTVASSVGPIAKQAAGVCVWQLIRYLRIKNGSSDVLHNRIYLQMIPLLVEADCG